MFLITIISSLERIQTEYKFKYLVHFLALFNLCNACNLVTVIIVIVKSPYVTKLDKTRLPHTSNSLI